MTNEEAISTKVKPCPFCGSHATVWRYEYTESYIIECDNEHCGCRYGDSMDLTEAEVITLWNSRHS